jgi:hypothetical protein
MSIFFIQHINILHLRWVSRNTFYFTIVKLYMCKISSYQFNWDGNGFRKYMDLDGTKAKFTEINKDWEYMDLNDTRD